MISAQKDNKKHTEELADLREQNRAYEATYQLFEIILASLDFPEMVQKIADIIPTTLGYETGVLALVDEKKNVLTRVAISQTKAADAGVKSMTIPFKKLEIPLGDPHNICIKALKREEQLMTTSLYDIVGPGQSIETAKKIQDEMGTNLSIVNPIMSNEKPRGVLIASTSKLPEEITDFEKELLEKFAENVDIALDRAIVYTKLKETQLDLNYAYKRLQALDRAKDDFLSVASHELRTPMTIIKSYLWMLQTGKYGNLNEKQKHYAQTAMDSTERLISLVNDMLNISRIEQDRMEFKIEKLNVCKTIKETLDELRIRADETKIYLKCKKEINCKESYIYADKNKLKEIIINLVGNSMKFTKQGGITVKLEKDEEKNHIRISVIDTGVGISKQDLKALFKKFGRLDNSYTKVAESGGTGLGLHIVKLYTKKMGGKVGVESEGDGKGSTFWFTLPTKKPKHVKFKPSKKTVKKKNKPKTTTIANAKKEKVSSIKP